MWSPSIYHPYKLSDHRTLLLFKAKKSSLSDVLKQPKGRNRLNDIFRMHYCHNDTTHVFKFDLYLTRLEDFRYIYSDTNICRRRFTVRQISLNFHFLSNDEFWIFCLLWNLWTGCVSEKMSKLEITNWNTL